MFFKCYLSISIYFCLLISIASVYDSIKHDRVFAFHTGHRGCFSFVLCVCVVWVGGGSGGGGAQVFWIFDPVDNAINTWCSLSWKK